MKKKILFLEIVVMLVTFTTICVLASSEYKMTYYSGTRDVVINLPEQDVTTNGESYNVSSQIPQREGYEFLGWVLDYGEGYKVTYVVNNDRTYGNPEGSSVPIDSKAYAPGDSVDVVEQLTTEVDYAFNDKGEKIVGTWEFSSWDKSDFDIHEDTTITGGWKFTPEAPKTYRYIVHYRLFDGKNNDTVVHEDTYGFVNELGKEEIVPALPLNQLKSQYRSAKKYRIKPGFESVKKVISKNDFEIYIFYERISSGQ